MITIYFNDFDTYRNIDVNLKDLDMVVKIYRAEKAGKQLKVNTRGKGKKKAGDDDGDDEDDELNKLNEARDVIGTLGQALGLTVDKLEKQLEDACNAMKMHPFNQDHRASDDYLIRILATSGLNWNAKSRFKNRDFAQIALAAVLESVIVPTYREDLTDPLVCPPVAALRGQLGHIISGMIKPSCGIKTWFFADQIDYPIEDPENPPRVYNPEELQEELNKSILVAKARKNDPIKKSVGVLLKNRYLRCSEVGVKPGTLETSVYYLILLFIKVSGIYSNLELGLEFAHAITDRL